MGNDTKQELIDLYKSSGAVNVNRSSGYVVRGMRISPFYIDGMRISTSSNGLKLACSLFLEQAHGLSIDAVAAPSISGVPYASVLSHALGVRLIIDRGTASKHGMKKRVEGVVQKGDRVLVVDDIAKRGQTLLEIGAELDALGASIVKALVVVDATTALEQKRIADANIVFEGLIRIEDIGVHPEMTLDLSTQP